MTVPVLETKSKGNEDQKFVRKEERTVKGNKCKGPFYFKYMRNIRQVSCVVK